MARSWICDGVPRDGKTYSNQNPHDKHEPYENYGADCVICGLPREAMVGGSKPPRKLLAAVITGVLAAFGGFLIMLIPHNSCTAGQQKIHDICVTDIPPTPVPTVPPPTPVPTVTPATPFTVYNTLATVPNVPKGTIRYGGSTSFAPLRSPQIVNLILQAHSGFELSYTDPPPGTKPGSGSGIKMLLQGQLSFAQSSRDVKLDEYNEAKTKGFTLDLQAVAIDGIAFYVNPQLSIPGLTVSQIKDIYTGRITNWNQVGGPYLEITPLSRDPEDGGTPEYFKEKVLANEQFAPSVKPYVIDTTTAIRRVARTPGGISYATASEVCNQKTIHSLLIAKGANQGFVSPCSGEQVNKADFAKDTYPLTRRLFVVIKRDRGLDEQAGVAYVNLLLSDDGQKLVDQVGLVPIRR